MFFLTFPFSLIAVNAIDTRIEEINTNELADKGFKEAEQKCPICESTEWMEWGEYLICMRCGFKKFK